MKTITKLINVYTFDELSEQAKAKAKNEYIENYGQILCEDFATMIGDELNELFPKSDLSLQFSLNYCQGDGMNFYGDLSAVDILEAIKPQLSEKEYKKARFYCENIDNFKLEYNDHYCYCIADRHNFYVDMIYELENQNFRNIDKKLLEKLNDCFSRHCARLCQDYVKEGYDYFYNITNEDFSELSEANEWLYLESGKFYE